MIPIKKLLAKFKKLKFSESITGLAHCETNYIPIAIYDLFNLKITKQNQEIELRSFQFGESVDKTNPSIATIALENNTGFHNSSYFLKDMRGSLLQQKNKSALTIQDPALLLPYYTTHFGHFTGDCLGAIIALSKYALFKKRKLFYIAPNHFDSIIEKYGNKDNLVKINSEQAFTQNLIFTDACLLPRISSWQNLSLCSQIFGGTEPPTGIKPKQVFLTSGRAGRIQNIDEVISLLKLKKIFILRPDDYPFEELLAIVRDAELVISENGSITHNLLISRNKPFYVLSAPGWNHLTPSEFAGGGIYNAYKSHLTHYIECQPCNTNTQHLFSTRIHVNLADLDALVKS